MYKILEKNGVFFIGRMVTKYKFLWWFPYEVFDHLTYNRKFVKFNTLKEAKEYINYMKPSVLHNIT